MPKTFSSISKLLMQECLSLFEETSEFGSLVEEEPYFARKSPLFYLQFWKELISQKVIQPQPQHVLNHNERTLSAPIYDHHQFLLGLVASQYSTYYL